MGGADRHIPCWTHLERVRQHLGFVRCDGRQRQRLLTHLIAVAGSAPRTDAVRKAAHRWLLEQRVVRPGRTTLRDLIATAREAGLQQTYAVLTRDLSEAQRCQLDGLLLRGEPTDPLATSPDDGDDGPGTAIRSPLDRLRLAPRRESPEVLLGLLDRLEAIEALGFLDRPTWPRTPRSPLRGSPKRSDRPRPR